MFIDPSHPRAVSLRIRERLVWGVKKGLTHPAGLLAHGRGEAFDYLLGEKTHDFAAKAIEAASAYLMTAKNPVISVNGNTSALCAKEIVDLAKLLNCKIEVNLFHYSQKRVLAIENYLSRFDSKVILRSNKSSRIILPEIASPRKIMLREGIVCADVVFIPLEDGDRAETLIRHGKKVITVDLNPLSRTARSATVTIVDNLIRVLPALINRIKKYKIVNPDDSKSLTINYDNKTCLNDSLKLISSRFKNLDNKI